MATNWHVSALQDRNHTNKVSLDVNKNLVQFQVIKKLNIAQTGKRVLVCDFQNQMLRNLKPDGSVAKEFPFAQISAITEATEEDPCHGLDDDLTMGEVHE